MRERHPWARLGWWSIPAAAALMACGGGSPGEAGPQQDGGRLDGGEGERDVASSEAAADGGVAMHEAGQDGETVVGDGSTAVPQTCDDLASLVCGSVDTCAPFFITIFFGDKSTCEAQVKDDCDYFGGAGSPLDMVACARALAAGNCHAVRTADLSKVGIPEVCLLPKGSQAAGTACGADTQCQSLACVGNGAINHYCGTCASSAAEGDVCGAMSVCDADLVCNLGTCSRPVVPGAPCDPSSDLACPGGTSCVSGVCQPAGMAGATCGATSPPCDHAHGFGCMGSTCAAIAVATSGQACGPAAFADCSGGLFCSGQTSTVCVAEHVIGGSCSGDAGTSCVGAIRCNMGVCSYQPPDLCH